MLLLLILFALQTLTVRSQKAPTLGPRCNSARVRIRCGNHTGIFWKVDDAGFTGARTTALFKPLDIAAGSRTIVAVCNFQDVEMKSDDEPIRIPIIPTLVNSIGEGAVVTVQVVNSVNKNATGSVLFRANPLRQTAPPALIGTLVKGSIGNASSLSVFVDDSANINMKAQNSSIYMKDSALIAPLIEPHGCIENTCIDVEVAASGNVDGTTVGRSLEMSNSSLISNQIKGMCINGGTQYLQIRSSGNVGGLQELVIGNDAKLVSRILSLDNMKNSKLSVSAMECARVNVSVNLESKNSTLFSGAIDTNLIVKSNLSILVYKAGNIMAGSNIKAVNSSAIGKLAKIRVGKESELQIFVQSSSEQKAKFIEGMGTIRTVVSLSEKSERMKIYATVLDSANIASDGLTIPKNVGLFECIADVSTPSDSFVSNYVNATANTNISGKIIINEGASLLRKMVHLRNAQGEDTVEVKALRTANLLCPGNEIATNATLEDGSALVDNIIDRTIGKVRVLVNLQEIANSFIPTNGGVPLVKNVVGLNTSVLWLHVRETFVAQRFTCDTINVRLL